MYLLTLEEWISTVLVRALGWTFTHSIWQALLALLIAYTALSVMKKAKPAARYNMLLAISLAFICTAAITFIYQMNKNATEMNEIISHPSLQKILYDGHSAATPVIIESKRILDLLLNYFNQYLNLVVATWFIIFCIKWLRLSLSLNYVNRISKYESVPAKVEWQSHLDELKEKLGINASVKLLHSNIVKVPLVSGILKPIILVPAGMFTNLPADLIESILLHELAHIKRRDYLVNIIQSSIETILFFNPFLLKLSDLIREEREACCDAIAVNVTNNKVGYVQALVAFGEYSTTSAPLLAFAGSKHHLLQRVKRILYNQNKKPGFMEKTILFSSAIMLFVVTAFTTINNERKPVTPVIREIKSLIMDTIPGKKNSEESGKSENIKRKKKNHESEELELKEKQIEELKIQIENMQKQVDNEINQKNKQLIQELQEAQKNIQNEKLIELAQLRAAELNFSLKFDTANIKRQIQAINQIQPIQLSQQLELSKIVAVQAVDQVRLQKSMIDSITTNLNLNIHSGFMNDDVEWILGFLERNKVADADDVKSFTLNEEELTVNGKKQPESLHQQLKEKYIGGKDDHIIYSNSGGSKSISINRNDPK